MIPEARGRGGAILILHVGRGQAKLLGNGATAHAKRRRSRDAFLIVLACTIVTLGATAASSAFARKHSRHHKSHSTEHHRKSKAVERAAIPRLRVDGSETGTARLSPDLPTLKQALALIRQRKFSEAKAAAASVTDPVAQKLIEWALLRNSDSGAGFDRYDAFINANPEWPSIPLLRRRAEARLWQEVRDPATIRNFAAAQPVGSVGRLALARVQIKEGNRSAAENQVRAIWHSASMSAELESAVLEVFHDTLTKSDHRLRMDRRIGAKEFGAAMRAAKRIGAAEIAIVKACEAAEANSGRGGDLLDAVPGDVRSDLGYALCRLHWLVARDQLSAALSLVVDSPRDGLQQQDTDEWWRECRMLLRKLIDRGDSKAAYQVAQHAPIPDNPYYRAEYYFMAGWIALRFLKEPNAAFAHSTHIDEGSADPIVLARGAYWRGRAAEAAGQAQETRAQYETAAEYPTAYYGQLARARLGLDQPALSPATQSEDAGQSELLQAANILYAAGEVDLVLSFANDLAETSADAATLNAIGQIARRYHDAQVMLVIGKTALARGLAVERPAFPDVGIPSYKPIAPPLDRSIAYSVVRTESGFDQRDASPAKAVGLMQVTPEAGRDTAKRFKVEYDWQRLVSDAVYNMQMGAAEISALLKEYKGSYILTFAGYNAGRGRVKEWVAKHGDPRDPKIDAVDWVERIPLAETRNYVQRVMENLQVYNAMFGNSSSAREPNLHRAAAIQQHVPPAAFVQVP
jgi:peptidoglycan lytic transglycosylase